MEQSNNIEEQLIPVRVAGKLIYRCPKFDRKKPTVDLIRSIHLQLKSFCEHCERNVSFVSFNRHVRSCIGGKVVAKDVKPLNISDHFTRSTTSTRPRLTHSTNVQREQTSIGQRSVDGIHIPKIQPGASSQQFDRIQTSSAVINEIALLWSYERSREDELDLFGKYVASEIRVLTKHDQCCLKKRIQQLLLEYDAPEESVNMRVETITNSQIISPEINLSSNETDMSSDQNYSVDISVRNDSHHAVSINSETQSLLIPKFETVDWPAVEDNSLKCLFCNRFDSDILHGNVNEISTSYTHTRVSDMIEGILGSSKPDENCVCCDTCLGKINKYDLERLHLQKVLQSDLLNVDP